MLYCLGKIWNDHGQTHIAISDVSMDQVTGFISVNTMSERRMVNQTGLDGRYGIHVVYPLLMQLQGEDTLEYLKVDAAKRREAFEKQLGLKFWLLTRKWKSVRFTRLFERRRILFSWRPVVVLSEADS